MSLLIFTFRRQSIISMKAQFNLRLMDLKKKLFDLQSYASSISDGSVSMNDLMKSPASMFGRMSLFMMASHQSALMGANQKFAYMSQIPGVMPQNLNGQQAEQFKYMMYKSLYEQERGKSAEAEKKQLDAQETKINQEVNELEVKLKMLDAEDGKLESAEEKATQKSVTYVA